MKADLGSPDVHAGLLALIAFNDTSPFKIVFLNLGE